MSDYDPYDPNRINEKRQTRIDPADGYSPVWGWIAGAVFLVLIAAAIYNAASTGTVTGENANTRPPATTGELNRPTAPPPARSSPRETTGQGTGQGTPSGSSK